MARNSRMELLDRLELRHTRILLDSKVISAAGRTLDVQTAGGATQTVDIGDCLVIATGPAPELSTVTAVEAAGVPYALAGDCNQPGDFLACLRDAWMVALSIDSRFAHQQAGAAVLPT